MDDIRTPRAGTVAEPRGIDTHSAASSGTRRVLRLTDSRVTGRWAGVIAAVRILFGVFIILASTAKFPFSPAYEQESASFVKWGFPDSALIVVLVGLLELGSGILLVAGFATRVAAAAMAVTMVGAISTAGVREGGYFHLGVAPTTLVVMLGLVWTGAGALALDRLVARRLRGTTTPA